MEHFGKSGLPVNAYTELKPGEQYVPIVPADAGVKEISFRSIFVGIIMTILFSGAIAFLGLKIAQVFEAAIPIAIIAVGIGTVMPRKSTILENVIIQSRRRYLRARGRAARSSRCPALFIMGLDAHINIFQLFFVPVLGAILGVLFLIPLRRYFVRRDARQAPLPRGDRHDRGPGRRGARAASQALVLAVRRW